MKRNSIHGSDTKGGIDRDSFIRAGLFAILAVIAGLTLPGCAQVQAKFNADLQTVTVPDLQAAVASANAANDADGAACWSEILAYVNSLPTTAPGGAEPTVAGVASALEAARVARLQGPVTFPPIPHSLHKACAVVIVDAQSTLAKLGLKVGALSVGGSAAAAAGAAKALKAVKAAKQ